MRKLTKGRESDAIICSGNDATKGGGMYLVNDLFHGSTDCGNQDLDIVSVVEESVSRLEIFDLQNFCFYNNIAEYGGAIYLGGLQPNTPTFSNISLIGNIANRYGGAIYFENYVNNDNVRMLVIHQRYLRFT